MEAKEPRVDVFGNESGFDKKQALPPMGVQGNGHPERVNLRDKRRPVMAMSISCIRLSSMAQKYELKNIYFNMLPSIYGLSFKDALAFV